MAHRRIDLIDGDHLYELLKRYDLSVRTATRTVEDVFIDVASFGDLTGTARSLATCCARRLMLRIIR
jgi:hypothetical protein